jgi:nucleoid-associated protein YgaU
MAQLKDTLKSFKESESLISAILGVSVVLLVALLAYNYFKIKPQPRLTSESASTASADLTLSDTDYSLTPIQATEPTSVVDILESSPTIELLLTATPEPTSIPTIAPSVAPVATLAPSKAPQPSLVSDKTDTKAQAYTVKTGDSLWSIAQEVYGDGNSWRSIATANNLSNPEFVHAGNELKLPDQIVEGQVSSIAAETYTVKTGDSLWSIAQEVYGDGFMWTAIYENNKPLIKNPQIIHPNLVLTLNKL